MPRRNPDIDQPVTLTREEKGQNLAFKKGAIAKLDANTYQVQSQSGNGHYVVLDTPFGKKCNCPDHVYRHKIPLCHDGRRVMSSASISLRSSTAKN